MLGTTPVVYRTPIKEVPLEIDLDLLLSQAERMDGRLVFEILESRDNGIFLIQLLRKDGTLTQAILTLNES